MSEHIQHLTDDIFDNQVLQSSVPVLVDFWAPWCGPCRFVAPVIEEIAKDYSGKIKVGKVDVDENPEVAGRYGISSIPTILLYKDGQVVDGVIGAVPKKHLQEIIDKHMVAKL